MLRFASTFFITIISVATALPTSPKELRYQYATDSNGGVHFVDLSPSWQQLYDVPRFDPVTSNAYHLFTRDNPTVSQPIVLNSAAILAATNFRASRRTIVVIHGWNANAVSEVTQVLVPTFLAAEDVNIIAVDWSVGATSVNYLTVIANTISSGSAVAGFIRWLNQASGASLSQYHIIGHGFGGHQAGIVGRNLDRNVSYITGLNPALVGWVNNPNRFLPNDGIYTEVIHTNYLLGYMEALAQVDLYPNGGISMPGCDSQACDDARSYQYFAESITSGGFTGKQCVHHFAAIMSLCNNLPGRLQMGGLVPKIGSRGVYWLETNGSPPFSQD